MQRNGTKLHLLHCHRTGPARVHDDHDDTEVFTILASVLIYPDKLMPAQWGGVACVFAGLGILHGKYQKRRGVPEKKKKA